MRVFASDYSAGSLTNGIQEAINSVPCGEPAEVAVERPSILSLGIALNKPNLRLVLDAGLTCAAGSSFVAVTITAPACEVRGRHGVFSIALAGQAGIMLLAGANDCTIRDVGIWGYNQTNTNGQAAIFAYGGAAAIGGLKILGCQTQLGNGNGIRLGNVCDAVVAGCSVSRTGGLSSEGMTLAGRNIRVIDCRLDSINVTGILVYGNPATPYQNIVIAHNIISNCSQTAAPGSHSAIQLDSQGGTICGVIIQGNVAYDDQAKPTTQNLLLVTDCGAGGTIQNCVVAGNVQWGCQNAAPILYNVKDRPSQLVNWAVS